MGTTDQNNEVLEVRFAHPRESARYFEAEVSPSLTAGQAIKNLLEGDDDGPFMDPPEPGKPYALVVSSTGQVMTPNMSFADAKVADGEVLEVGQRGSGA
ncbi:MAG TPA: hypothetical protein VF952_00815 [Chloroflexia bacterium]|jgi:hypothetical protein